MHLGKFTLYTSLGAGIWVAILTMLGYFMGSQEELIRQNLQRITLAALAFVTVSTLVYVLYRRARSKRRAPRK